jgi:3-dehydrosphinganine reductase
MGHLPGLWPAPAWLGPGRFLDLTPGDHQASLAVNIGGALNLLHGCLPAMVRQGAGRVVLVSSASVLTSLHGFSAYSPSKAALRALGDVLSLELALDGISVTTAFPPDTDTPQLREELRARPTVTRLFLGRNRVHAADRVERRIVRDALLGRRYSTVGLGARFLLALSALGDHPGRQRQMKLDASIRGRL